jgi:RNA polymerase sigma factor (sigma-70 family)
MEPDEQFERLYREHASALLGFLVYRTGDLGLAEDVHADTFERVLTSRRRPSPGRGEKAWLYTIALNRLRDVLRRRGAERQALERAERLAVAPADFGTLDAVERRDLIHRGLAALPDEEREALALRYGGDLSLREIAEVTGQPQTTAEGRVYRGLKRLREELSEPRPSARRAPAGGG